MFGVVTAVFGGVLRDIVCNEIPSAFSDHRPYAVCSFFGGRVLMASQALQAPAWVGSVGAAGVAAGLRMLAFARGYSLPQWSIGDSSTGDAQPGSGPAIQCRGHWHSKSLHHRESHRSRLCRRPWARCI